MAITASEARRRLFELIEKVNDDADSIEIISRKGTAYLVPDQEYRSLRELAHLCRTPANAIRFFSSLQEAREGLAEEHELIDADERAVS